MGKDSWKKIVVCIVSDGRTKINERAQALLAGLGVYQEGLAKSRVDDKKCKLICLNILPEWVFQKLLMM